MFLNIRIKYLELKIKMAYKVMKFSLKMMVLGNWLDMKEAEWKGERVLWREED